MRAYRELLQVAPGASSEELKKAYHKMARAYHPDLNTSPGSADEFQRVREAYEILLDPIRVRELNQGHLRARLFNDVVDGLAISYGAFFGYRAFAPSGSRVERRLRLGQERSGESDVDAFGAGALEMESSILDSAAFDAIEIVYAGQFSVEDEARLNSGHDGRHVRSLPWVVLNNQGLLHFLDGDLERARRCYEELNARIPKNILFMYRLGLCHVLLGFKNTRRDWLGRRRPDRTQVDAGLKLFKQWLALGGTRPVGKQDCLVIRKFLADVYDKLGRRRAARREWRAILERRPNSLEALWKVKGLKPARAALSARDSKLKANNEARAKLKQLTGSST